MKFYRSQNLFVALAMVAVLTAGVSFVLQDGNSFVLGQTATMFEGQNSGLPIPLPLPEKLKNPPEVIRAAYVTSWSASSKSYLDYLSRLFRATEINAVVVDIKDSTGVVSYKSGAISDIDALVRFFHEQNVYVIGRIAVFEDPVFAEARPDLAVYDKTKTSFALWHDRNGLSWLDPASKDVWEYNISLAKDTFYHGFDEMNFDYIRFPTDGRTENMGFPVWDTKTPKQEVIKGFFQYARQELVGEKISADLFGQTTTDLGDMGIGQLLENAFENFDYVSPMVYPSHYAEGFMGFENPAEHPYEIVKYSMDSAQSRKKAFLAEQQELILPPAPISLAKLRPWLQDFDMGADYTADMIKKEIKGAQDALGEDYRGFMLWSPSNIYTQAAVLKFE